MSKNNVFKLTKYKLKNKTDFFFKLNNTKLKYYRVIIPKNGSHFHEIFPEKF